VLWHLYWLATERGKCLSVFGEKVNFGTAEITDKKVCGDFLALFTADHIPRVAKQADGRRACLQFTKSSCG